MSNLTPSTSTNKQNAIYLTTIKHLFSSLKSRVLHYSLFSIHYSLFCLLPTAYAFAQSKITIDGYAFEENNRGFVNEVKITCFDKSEVYIGEVVSDTSGHFVFDLPSGQDYILMSEKKIFITRRDTISTKGAKSGDKIFAKILLRRQPGYLLEVTLAEKRTGYEVPVDAVNGAKVEIYNNSLHKEVLVIPKTTSPSFSYNLEQGNHYTIFARHTGYYNKRLEAHVNIDGCILCMEGFGTVTPGVLDNLTLAQDLKLGTLLTNVELEKMDTTHTVVLNNIYYNYNSYELTLEAKKELDKVANVLKDNPSVIMELGSHTDTRGSDEFNNRLSQSRAEAAVNYILSTGKVEGERLKPKGYGKSHIINHCTDGVPCSEAEHKQNRRTELRIVGFSIDPYKELSLAEIIHEEELQRFVNNNAFSDNTQYKTSEPPATPNPEFISPKPPADPTPVIKEKVKQAEPITETMSDKGTPSTTPKRISQTSNLKPQTPNPKSTPATKIVFTVKPVPADYIGYKIEIMTTDKELSLDDNRLNEIAQESSDINIDPAGAKVAYLIGAFQFWGETESYLNKVIKRFPNAKIVDIYKGKRVN